MRRQTAGQKKARLVGIYGSGLVRQLRLLKLERTNTGHLEAFLNFCIDQAIKELGIDRIDPSLS